MNKIIYHKIISAILIEDNLVQIRVKVRVRA